MGIQLVEAIGILLRVESQPNFTDLYLINFCHIEQQIFYPEIRILQNLAEH
jgi:hypothetical protein